MFLKSMDMFGFKSFADRTRVEFEPGVTIVVGPNGCGKSNIVDAIKWVLGEKKARNIRGETMEDVIFTGTDKRKALSLAEVALTIDNTDRILDFDSDSVTVGRRVFRDGESEYLINKSPVRLKDIEKLFMDTGIGKSAYSVMEQGKIDLILSTKAEDRRYLFEEAAGISRYKLQKKESLKKLQDTGDNLERINDIIKEIEREKELKARQAEKTKVYLGFRDEMVKHDIILNVLRFKELQAKQDKLQEDVERLKKERENISARVSSVSAENEKDEKRKNDIQHQLFEHEKRLHAYRIRLEDIDAKTDRNRKLIEEQKQRKQSVEKKVEERKNNLARLQEEKKTSEESRVSIRKKIEDDKENLKNFFDNRKKKITSIHEARDSIDKNREDIAGAEERLGVLRDSLEEVVRRLIDAIEKRKAELQQSEEERQSVRSDIHELLSGIDTSLIRARQGLETGDTSMALDSLRSIDLSVLKDRIGQFESFEDGFRSILFDRTGIHAEKESLDKKIQAESDMIQSLREANTSLDQAIQRDQGEVENINGMITRVEKDLSRNENERDWIEKHIQSLNRQIEDINRQIENHYEDIRRTDKAIETLTAEITEWEERLIEFNERSKTIRDEINALQVRRDDLEKKMNERRSVSRKDEEELQKINERISQLDRNLVELIFRKNSIEDYLWTEYERKQEDFHKIQTDNADAGILQNSIQELKKKIQDLGPINNLAIEEYKDLKKRFEYYIKQRDDIKKAREDILSVIAEINTTSIEMFIDTFKEIEKNFSAIFRQLFEGGEATITLQDPDNVLESGIEIMVRPPGKKLKNINLLSGGERALTAIALLFATYMVKPSPFCFLDEIDAPLDEENIGRFVRMLREFARSTQFVIVSHNKKTMSIGDLIYGITMEEPGISKVVSLKMEKIDQKYLPKT